MKDNEQILRIRKMETALDKAKEALEGLEKALDHYGEAAEAIAALSAYYGSEDWLQDFDDDNAGKLPPVEELKRGILSEDGIYDVLVLERELLVQMLEIVSEHIREGI